MDMLRRFGEPVFWAIVVLGTLPAILSNSLIPWNWYLPFTVESIGPAFLSGLNGWGWLALFGVGIIYALLKRSPIRAIAVLPLLILWFLPNERIDIDYSHPVDRFYLEEYLAEMDVNFGRPTELRDVESTDGFLELTAVYEYYIRFAEKYPTQFDDSLEIERLRGGQQVLHDHARVELGIAVADPDRIYGALKEFISSGHLPNQALMIAAANIEPKVPGFMVDWFMPSTIDEYRAELVATIEGNGDARFEDAFLQTVALITYAEQVETEFYSIVLSLVSMVSLILLGLFGRFRPLLILAIFAAGVAYAAIFWAPLAFFGAVQGVLLVAFFVFIAGFINSNKEFFHSLGRPQNLRNLGRTLVPWSIFLLLFAGSIYLSSLVTSKVTEQVYQIRYPQYGEALFSVEESGAGLEVDLRDAADRHYDYLNSATAATADNFNSKVQNNVEDAVDDTMRGIENAITDVIFESRDFAHCLKPPDLLCPLVNEIKRAINRSYRAARNRHIARIDAALTKLANGSKAEVAAGVGELKREVALATQEAAKWTTKGISGLFLWYHIATTLSITFLIFVLVKSFLFIASRVYLHADDVNQQLWEGMARTGGVGVPVPCEKTYVFDRARWGTFYVRRGQSNKNIKRDISWPQARRMIFRRLATRLFALYREDWSRDHGEKFVKTTKGGEFVEWQLAEGQRVIFQLGNLAAFSETVKLRSLWSFRLSHFIFGKVLFSSVEGSGMILLRTNGEPHIGKPDERFILGAAPNEHIAFDLATDFLVNSDLKLKNIYFSDIEVVANDSPRVVVDVMPEHSFTGGAARFIRAFFIPV